MASRKTPATVHEIITAQSQGEQAARSRLHVSNCPYRGADADERTRFLALMWTRGYRQAQARLRSTPKGE